MSTPPPKRNTPPPIARGPTPEELQAIERTFKVPTNKAQILWCEVLFLMNAAHQQNPNMSDLDLFRTGMIHLQEVYSATRNRPYAPQDPNN